MIDISKIEEKIILEKVEQLKKIKERILTSRELADLITQRRVKWIEEHLNEMLIKYKGLNLEEQAYKIIFFEHMKINPEHSKMIRISLNKIRINSYNFCPYLEASKLLGLNTKFICKEVVEPSINEMLRIINPNLRFNRNYENIRPYNLLGFCEEYIELLK